MRWRLPGARSKFGNRRTRNCASRLEADRLDELTLLARAGQIEGLSTQVAFALDVNDIHVADYVADSVYVEKGILVVEDTKGMREKTFRLKARLFRAIYGFEIREVGATRPAPRRKTREGRTWRLK